MKVKVCVMLPLTVDVEIEDETIEAWENDELLAWSMDCEPNFYNLVKDKLKDVPPIMPGCDLANAGELVWAENADTGETLCEW